MSITTLSGVRSGIGDDRLFIKSLLGGNSAGRLGSSWSRTSLPVAGSYDGTLNGVTLNNTTTGALSYGQTSGADTYLATLEARAFAGYHVLLLCDRLWHNGGFTITSTSAQSITSPTWPARDNDSSTNGKNVLLACEVSATTGAGTPTITVGYTNSDGTSGRTATNIVPTTASSAVGVTNLLGLQAGDRGVRSVQSLTLSATWTSGTINLVAFRPICMFQARLATDSVRQSRADVLSLGMPKIIDGSCLFFYDLLSSALDIHGSYRTTAG